MKKTECSVIMFVRAEPGKKVPASRTLMRALEVSHNDITFSTGGRADGQEQARSALFGVPDPRKYLIFPI